MSRQYVSKPASPKSRSKERNSAIARRSSYGSLSSVVHRAKVDPEGVGEEERQQLDSAMGTRASRELLGGQVAPPLGNVGISQGLWGVGNSMGVPIQAKLTIGDAGDKYELEADRVAKEVVQRINEPSVGSIEPPLGEDRTRSQVQPIRGISRKVQRQEGVVSGAASPAFEQGINKARGGGRPLDAAFRGKVEPVMGADFSGVRVHTDGAADELSRSIQAKAFTTGQDVYFRKGAYEPGSSGGQELLAHELTHVQQQSLQGGPGLGVNEVKRMKMTAAGQEKGESGEEDGELDHGDRQKDWRKKITSNVLEKGKLYVIGEVHSDYNDKYFRKRKSEKEVLKKLIGGSYWEEYEFRFVFARGALIDGYRYGDPKQWLAFQRAYEVKDSLGSLARCTKKRVSARKTYEEIRSFKKLGEGVNSVLRRMISTYRKESYIVDDDLKEGIKEAKKTLKLAEVMEVDEDKLMWYKEEIVKRYTFWQWFTTRHSFEDIVYERSRYMYYGATCGAKRGMWGVWKVGESHIQDILRSMPDWAQSFRSADTVFMSRDQFKSSYWEAIETYYQQKYVLPAKEWMWSLWNSFTGAKNPYY